MIFFQWVDAVVEVIPITERDLRNEYTNANQEYNEKYDDYKPWCNNNSAELADAITHQQIGNSMADDRVGGTREFVYIMRLF